MAEEKRPIVVVVGRPVSISDIMTLVGLGIIGYIGYRIYRWAREHGITSWDEFVERVKEELRETLGGEIVIVTPAGEQKVTYEEIEEAGGFEAYCKNVTGGDWFGYLGDVPEGYTVLWTYEMDVGAGKVTLACAKAERLEYYQNVMEFTNACWEKAQELGYKAIRVSLVPEPTSQPNVVMRAEIGGYLYECYGL